MYAALKSQRFAVVTGRNAGSTTNEVRGAFVVTRMRLILKGCQKLAGGRRQAHHRSTVHGDLHPEGMPEATNLAPLSGCKRNFMLQPVVALSLPPANFSNRFTVNHKKRHHHRPWMWFHPFRTRALNLTLNQNMELGGGIFPAVELFLSCVFNHPTSINPSHILP